MGLIDGDARDPIPNWSRKGWMKRWYRKKYLRMVKTKWLKIED